MYNINIKNDNSILFGDCGFLPEAIDIQISLEKEGREVELLGYTDFSDFINKYNSMGFDHQGKEVSIDRVYIIDHGSPESMNVAGELLKFDPVINQYVYSRCYENQLDFDKNIDELYLNGCNTGNIDCDSNLAIMALRNLNVNTVYAYDGYVKHISGLGLYSYDKISTGSGDDKNNFSQTRKKAEGLLKYEKSSSGKISVTNKKGKEIKK